MLTTYTLHVHITHNTTAGHIWYCRKTIVHGTSNPNSDRHCYTLCSLKYTICEQYRARLGKASGKYKLGYCKVDIKQYNKSI